MILTREGFLERLEGARRPHQHAYLAMYSTLFGGIVTDPLLMMVPIDDHIVHRGDGVFETFKCVDGGVYNLDAHLERLLASALAIGLRLPMPPEALRATVLDTIAASAARDCAVRMFLSRGPGSFGVNPYDCPDPQLYVVVTRLPSSFMDLHPDGARVGISGIPVKPPFFAGIKHCNYLPNVLMKKEAVDAGLDFVVAFDAAGLLTEGATENIGIVTSRGALVCPAPGPVLCGTTMVRVMELAGALVSRGLLAQVAYGDVRLEDMRAASEILVFGTTTDVTHVREFDGRALGEPGPVFRELSALLLADIRAGEARRTPVAAGPDGTAKDLAFRDALHECCFLPSLQGESEDDVVEEMVRALHRNGRVRDPEAVIEAVREREEQMTTGIQDGVAVPHGKHVSVASMAVAIGLKHDGVDFRSLDGKPARIIVMTVTPPTETGPHMHFMAAIGRMLNQAPVRDAVLRATDRASLLRALDA